MESTLQTAKNLIQNCSDEIDGSEYVQSETTILSKADRFSDIHALLRKVLEVVIEGNSK